MSKLFCILGPTATGKTDLGLYLAKKFNGEIIACDSRQVYIDLDIGTGKLPGKSVSIKKYKNCWEIDGAKVWMYDVVDLNTQYTVAGYVKDATKVIEEIINRGKIPVLVGGTGLYLKALIGGLPNLNVPVDQKLREELEMFSLQELQNKLQQLSPSKWEELNSSDKQNPRRLLRSIEISSMNPYARRVSNSKFKVKNFDVLKIGLTAPREVLYKKVNLRVFDWINQGIIEEVEGFINKGVSANRIRNLGLEYRVIVDYLDGKVLKENLKSVSSQAPLIKTIQNNIHGYVRRQLTWFKKEKDINWFDITQINYLENLEKLAYRWYYNSNDS